MSTEQSGPGHLLSGRYRLTELIGTGGMGRVWEGTDELLDRPVAIKELIISPNLPQHEVEVLRTRMLREARSAAQLSHPSIITVFDVVEIEERPWIVMELVRGPSLSDVIKQDGTLPPARVARIGLQVAAALAVAHDRGIVHRDIKPGNVLIARDDRAVLTDFGIARLEGTTNLTSTGLLVGSPGYLAPEQAHGHKATPATDMWSLGVTLYQAVQGTPPFLRSTPVATLTAIVTEDVPLPTAAGPLRPLLERLLDKEPENRPSVHEAARMLQEAADSGARTASAAPAAAEPKAVPSAGAGAAPVPAPPEAPTAVPPGAGRHGNRSRRSLLPYTAAAVALLLAFGAGFWVGLRDRDEAGPAGADSGQASNADASNAGKAGGAETEPSPDSADEEEDSADEEDEEDEGPPMDRHEDPSGFSVDIPEDWEYDRTEGSSVYFSLPDGGYLQIDQTDDPKNNAKKDWEKQEPISSANFDGYALKGITELDESYMDGYKSAADWEFTFSGSSRGTPMHAINRGFHTKEKGYALFLVSTEDKWEENRELLDPITESFEPAA